MSGAAVISISGAARSTMSNFRESPAFEVGTTSQSSPTNSSQGSPPSPSRLSRSDRSTGHSLSSLTMAMDIQEHPFERKSFFTYGHADSSDEENLADAAKLSTHGTHSTVDSVSDQESLSSSIRDHSLSVVGSYDNASPSLDNGKRASSNLFVEIGSSPGGEIETGKRSTSSDVGEVDVQLGITASSKFTFLGRDLLKLAINFLDKMTHTASLNADTLSSIASTKDKIDASCNIDPASASMTRLKSYRLMAAETDGEIMDDLPDFGLNTDVLGMGVSDFAVVDKESSQIVLLVRTQEQSSPRGISGHSPRSGPHTTASTPTPPVAILSASAGTNTDLGNIDNNLVGSSTFGIRAIGMERSNTDSDMSVNGIWSRRSFSRAITENEIGTSQGTGKVSKLQLLISCREPKNKTWTIVKKVRVIEEVKDPNHDLDHRTAVAIGLGLSLNARIEGGGSAGVPGATVESLVPVFRGATTAAELSALRALAASTASEIYGQPGDTLLSETDLSSVNDHLNTNKSIVEPVLRRGDSSGKYSDNSNMTKESELTEGAATTWQRVTSYNSAECDIDNIDDDSQATEATGASSYASPMNDGGCNDDLDQEDDLDVLNTSQLSGSDVRMYSNSARNTHARDRSISNRSNPDGELFRLDLED